MRSSLCIFFNWSLINLSFVKDNFSFLVCESKLYHYLLRDLSKLYMHLFLTYICQNQYHVFWQCPLTNLVLIWILTQRFLTYTYHNVCSFYELLLYEFWDSQRFLTCKYHNVCSFYELSRDVETLLMIMMFQAIHHQHVHSRNDIISYIIWQLHYWVLIICYSIPGRTVDHT